MFWGALSAVFGNLVSNKIGFWFSALLTSAGIGLVTQHFAVEPGLAAIQGAVNGLPADALAWAAYLGIDDVITTVVSAYGGAALMGGVRLRRKAA